MIDPHKLERMQHHLASLGLKRSSISPPIHRLAWRLGFNIEPPLFAPFRVNVVFFGTYFGAVWGLFMWVFIWKNMSIPVALGAAFLAGLLFGLGMAWYFRKVARSLDLPAWSQYTGDNAGRPS
jgi:hypothetical protein